MTMGVRMSVVSMTVTLAVVILKERNKIAHTYSNKHKFKRFN